MITLPAGLRFEVVDNYNLRLTTGQKGTLQFEEFVSPTEFLNELKIVAPKDIKTLNQYI